jgi:hypothetical protein
MAKSKNHTAHNQSYKAHRNGIKKPKTFKYKTRKGVRYLSLVTAYDDAAARVGASTASQASLFLTSALRLCVYDADGAQVPQEPGVIALSRTYDECSQLAVVAMREQNFRGGTTGWVHLLTSLCCCAAACNQGVLESEGVEVSVIWQVHQFSCASL